MNRIRNESLYYDRTVQDWHYAAFPTDHSAIDIDLMGACKMCSAPVYLIEATTKPQKSSRMLLALAKRAHVPAFVIWHDLEQVVRSRMIWPQIQDYDGELMTRLILMIQRNNHTRLEHPDYWKYLTERKTR